MLNRVRTKKNTRINFNNLLHITRKKYYNLISFITRNDDDILLKFFQTLKKFDEKFISKIKYKYVLNDNETFLKKIETNNFINRRQKKLIKRFCFN